MTLMVPNLHDEASTRSTRAQCAHGRGGGGGGRGAAGRRALHQGHCSRSPATWAPSPWDPPGRWSH
jgi:hypothetical protein